MTKLTLYYPTFVDKDVPETTDFNSLDDLKKDPVIRNRMFSETSELLDTFAYDTLKPDMSACNLYYKYIFHKLKMYQSDKMVYWGAAIVTGDTPDAVKAGLDMLGTTIITEEDS